MDRSAHCRTPRVRSVAVILLAGLVSLKALFFPWSIVLGSEGSGADTFSTDELLRITDIAALALSPDGQQVAFVARQASREANDYRADLYVMETRAGAEPRHLGRVTPHVSVGTGFVNQRLKWAHDGKRALITYLAAIDGTNQVWGWDPQGGAPQCLTDAATDVASFAVMSDGKTLFYTVTGLAGTPAARAKVEKDARENGMLYSPPISWGDYRDDRGVARYVGLKLDARVDHGFCDIEHRRCRPAEAAELEAFKPGFPASDEIDSYRTIDLGARYRYPPVWIYHSAVSPDGRKRAFHTKERVGGRRESVLSVGEPGDEKQVEWFRGVEAPVSSLHWSEDSSRLYFERHRYRPKGAVEYGIFYSSSEDTELRQIYASTGLIEHVAFDRTPTKAVFLESSATQPSQIVLVDVRTGHRSVLYDPNPWIKAKRLTAPTLLPFTNRYGVNAFAYLVKPFRHVEGKKYPFVVVVYRAGGFLRGGTGDEYPIYPLASAGFAVLVVDAGEAFVVPEDGSDFSLYSRFWSAQATIEEAVGMAERSPWIDRSRRALTGLSYGGNTAWFTLTHIDLFHAAIVSDSGIDPFSFYLAGIGNPGRSDAWTAAHFPVPILDDLGRARWQELGASANASQLRAPMLINDSDREFAHHLGTLTTLTGLGKPFEMHIYPGAGHIIHQPAQRYSIYNRNVDWLRFWLKGEEDRDPVKAEQYARWHALREQHEWNVALRARGMDPGVEFARQRRAKLLRQAVPDPDLAPALRQRSID